MPVKYIVSIFAAALIGYSISNSYSQEVIFCSGFECPEGAPALEARVAALEALLAGVNRGVDPNTSQDTLTFANMNVQVVNGSGNTGGAPTATGNLIIGYNELRGGGDDRTGSHMLVMGDNNNYSSYGGIVAGNNNTASGDYASASGGENNTASGHASSISGGQNNSAIAGWTSVSGGNTKTADFDHCTTAGDIGSDCAP